MTNRTEVEEYHRPRTVQEAQLLLMRHGIHGRLLAGGTKLLAERLKEVTCLISLRDLHLDYIRGNPDGIHIGAMTTFRQLLESPLMHVNPFNVLTDATKMMGHWNIQNMATIGGNLCNFNSSADAAPPLIVLESRAIIASVGKRRIVPLEVFFTGFKKTDLKEGEILIEIYIPQHLDRSGASFKKFSGIKSDSALVNTAVMITLDEENICTKARVVLGSVTSTPMRIKETENTLIDQVLTKKIAENAALYASEEFNPINNINATAAYQRNVTQVLVEQAILEAYKRAMVA